MDTKTSLLCENAQYITLDAWPIIYGEDNQYDQNSRDLFQTFRDWAEEFEEWWQSHDKDWQEYTDYLEEIELFAERKAKEYVEHLK